jgi:AcrR family transcriptional regulator
VTAATEATGMPGDEIFSASRAEHRVLDAARSCCERWGMDRVTVDDIAAEAGISRATLYRLFPGGKDVLFEALRTRESLAFFVRLGDLVSAAGDFEDVVVSVLVEATRALRTDEHLKIMLASRPGEVLYELQVTDVPRILELATEFLSPLVAPSIGRARSAELADWLTRVVLSYFFTPSPTVDLADRASAAAFARAFVLPAFAAPAAPAAPGAATRSAPSVPAATPT